METLSEKIQKNKPVYERFIEINNTVGENDRRLYNFLQFFSAKEDHLEQLNVELIKEMFELHKQSMDLRDTKRSILVNIV